MARYKVEIVNVNTADIKVLKNDEMIKLFKELRKGNYEEVEQHFIDYWKENDILQKSIDKSNNYFVFYDGPATANGHPGLHHMVAKFLKDSFCKYKTMQGYKVLRKVGWDTHGLPVEVEAEKKLGFNSPPKCLP